MEKGLTKREKAAKKRIENGKRTGVILEQFFDKGFKRLEAIMTIARYYEEELSVSEVTNFWHFRNVSDDMLAKMEYVLEQLKRE